MSEQNKILNIITKEKLERYLAITERALEIVKNSKKSSQHFKLAIDFLDMASRYYSDAKFFYSKGDWINAFASVNYAHGWLDAGARAGLFDVHDSTLFTVDD